MRVTKRTITAALPIVVAANFGFSATAEAGYVKDSAGQVYMNSYGECWQDRWGSEEKLAQCGDKPDTPAPMDSDGDGVTDDRDRCPGTPAGVKVDARGCPLDTDNDGVSDDKDRCPNTPPGTKVDAEGCPLDSDGDGVLDGDDQCPDTPRGQKVNKLGCHEPIVLKGVNFETASAVLTAQARSILEGVASTLKKHSDLKVTIAGHTDNRGSRDYNQGLSQQRAESVMNFLISQGVGAANLAAEGHGEDQPVADNDTAKGQAANRRVELRPADK